jgi:hypothetical protein
VTRGSCSLSSLSRSLVSNNICVIGQGRGPEPAGTRRQPASARSTDGHRTGRISCRGVAQRRSGERTRPLHPRPLSRASPHLLAGAPFQRPASGSESPRQIFRARRSGISLWRGTASTAPVCGLHQREWDRPSRLRKHPCRRRCRRSAARFTRA